MDLQDDSLGTNSINCVVELENRTFLNFSDLTQYALISPDGNVLNLGEIDSQQLDENHNNSIGISWPNDSHDTNASSSLQTSVPNSEYSANDMCIIKAIESITENKTSTPCRGQGDGTDSPLFKALQDITYEIKREATEDDVNDSTSDMYSTSDYSSSNNNDGSSGTSMRNNAKIEVDDSQMVYAALESISPTSCVNYDTPRPSVYRQGTIPPVSNQASGQPTDAYHPRTLYSKDNSPFTLRPSYPNANVRGRKPWRQSLLAGRPPFLSSSSSTCSSGPNSSGSDYSFDTTSSSVPMENVESPASAGFCSDTSPDLPKVPSNTPNSEDASCSSLAMRQPTNRMTHSQLASKLERLTRYPPPDLRESHNAKERKRRSRIRDACQAMRRLIPSVYDRTDNATVFEHLASYVQFLQLRTENKYDFDYIQRCQQRRESFCRSKE